jgi:hypothetical protein
VCADLAITHPSGHTTGLVELLTLASHFHLHGVVFR